MTLFSDDKPRRDEKGRMVWGGHEVIASRSYNMLYRAGDTGNELREQLADVQHGIWAHWMRYQFGVCQRNEDGSFTIPADMVRRWERQAGALYGELTEQERESDRHQADKIIMAIRHLLEAAALAEVYGPRAEEAEAALAAVPRQAIEALFFQQFGESPIWFDKRWDPIAEWLGLE